MFGFVHNPHPTHTQTVWQYAPRYAPRWRNALFYIFTVFKTHYFTNCAAFLPIFAFFVKKRRRQKRQKLLKNDFIVVMCIYRA